MIHGFQREKPFKDEAGVVMVQITVLANYRTQMTVLFSSGAERH